MGRMVGHVRPLVSKPPQSRRIRLRLYCRLLRWKARQTNRRKILCKSLRMADRSFRLCSTAHSTTPLVLYILSERPRQLYSQGLDHISVLYLLACFFHVMFYMRKGADWGVPLFTMPEDPKNNFISYYWVSVVLSLLIVRRKIFSIGSNKLNRIADYILEKNEELFDYLTSLIGG